MTNGNGTKWSIWMAGIIATLLIGAVTTLATNVVANDKAARDRDTSQVKETSAVKADIREIKTAQIYMQKDMDAMRVEQKEGFHEIKELINTMHATR